MAISPSHQRVPRHQQEVPFHCSNSCSKHGTVPKHVRGSSARSTSPNRYAALGGQEALATTNRCCSFLWEIQYRWEKMYLLASFVQASNLGNEDTFCISGWLDLHSVRAASSHRLRDIRPCRRPMWHQTLANLHSPPKAQWIVAFQDLPGLQPDYRCRRLSWLLCTPFSGSRFVPADMRSAVDGVLKPCYPANQHARFVFVTQRHI